MRVWTRFSIGCLAAALLMLGSVPAADAAPILINSSDSGFCYPDGSHTPGNLNYEAGWEGNDIPGGAELRNFFVFPIGTITGTITGVSLVLYNPASGELGGDGGYSSPDATETFVVTKLTTTTPAALSGGAVDPSKFIDLGTTPYAGASAVMSDLSDGTSITIDLLAAAGDIMAAQGGSFAVGGYVSALSTPAGVDERVFGFTNSIGGSQPYPRLEITTDGQVPGPAVPEPTTLALLGGALVALARRRRK